MTKALVTGANGLLGQALVTRLRADGVFVRAFIRPGQPNRSHADETCYGDLADTESLRRAIGPETDWVFHAGARVRTDGSWKDFESVNIHATAEILRLSVQEGVRRIIHVSSLGVYGVPHDGAVISEDSAFDEGATERGFYARSKAEADRLVLAAIDEGAPAIIVRPGLLYGPGKKPPLGRRVLSLGPLRVVLAGRDYLLPLAYVDNVAAALCLAASREGAVGRAYTIVDAHVRQEDHLKLYREVTGASWRAVYLPLGGVRIAARAVESLARGLGRKPPITAHQVERTLCSATFDGRRASDELGWSPHIGIRESMQRSLLAGRRDEARSAPAERSPG